ncbi:hypothetical protein CDV55_107418 [Aspergillus turcosus]|uniref:Uncharacterized protein n=1 Tax=Aspergillus turcosus TaxID=1245748 RepID=A0A397HPZ2_9EURO|nr:hypothetical protein CDV55_107418 [Aspergillus turcosus]RLL98421.1 hypothetical protein CFD26_107413 [Aspergillus turcosus]
MMISTQSSIPLDASSDNIGGPAVDFKTYETSVAIIERTGWRIQWPIGWINQSVEGTIGFLKEPSLRDKRKLLQNHRFRILPASLVESPDAGVTTTAPNRLSSVISAAKASGYITERFDYFLKNDTAGSATLGDPTTGITFIAQTPQDDGYPFFALSLNHRPQESHSYGIDWECFLFVRPSSLWCGFAEPLLCADPFPHDSPAPIPADLMVLPVVLLRWQVEQIMTEVNEIKRALMTQYKALLVGEAVAVEELRRARDELFRLWQKNLFLRRRWDFAQELAGNLLLTFGVLEKRYFLGAGAGAGSGTHEMVGAQGSYSPTLTEKVLNQKAILKSVVHDIDTTASRIESQQKLVDDQSKAVMEYRDRVSMRIIAIVTLIFLPATFLATFFSMTFFNWNAGLADSGRSAIVSQWIWLYFALSVASTLIVVFVWKAVSKCEERKRKRMWADKIV